MSDRKKSRRERSRSTSNSSPIDHRPKRRRESVDSPSRDRYDRRDSSDDERERMQRSQRRQQRERERDRGRGSRERIPRSGGMSNREAWDNQFREPQLPAHIRINRAKVARFFHPELMRRRRGGMPLTVPVLHRQARGGPRAQLTDRLFEHRRNLEFRSNFHQGGPTGLVMRRNTGFRDPYTRFGDLTGRPMFPRGFRRPTDLRSRNDQLRLQNQKFRTRGNNKNFGRKRFNQRGMDSLQGGDRSALLLSGRKPRRHQIDRNRNGRDNRSSGGADAKKDSGSRAGPQGSEDEDLDDIDDDTDGLSDEEHQKNNYTQHNVDTGQRPQNFIRDTDVAERLLEYPKLRELINLKNKEIEKTRTPPMCVQCDLKTYDLKQLGVKYDVILVDPPWEEYHRRCPGAPKNNAREVWSCDEIMKLNVPDIAANPSFLFLWAGSCQGLNEARKILKHWGYRRCEVIVWVKTNKNESLNSDSEIASRRDESLNDTILQHTTEHCLMGIRGTVRRSVDGHFIHANVDTDVIISEEPEYGSADKPQELYEIIERFCLGRKRLELFGESHNVRPGWVTVGKEEFIGQAYDKESYMSHFVDVPNLVPSTERIELLRPRSPQRKGKPANRGMMHRQRGGRGGRGGRGARGARGARGGRGRGITAARF